MNSFPLVSVVIPSYNRAHSISETLESVFSQTYPNVEILVVDDGSTDNTRAVIESIDNPALKYIYQENKGASGARNTGIDNSSGEYIAFLDSDDLWLPSKLEEQVAFMEKNNECALVLCECDIHDNGKFIENSSFAKRYPNNKDFFESFLKHMVITCSIMFFRKDMLNRIGYFDEDLKTAEDKDLVLRTASQFEVKVLPSTLVKYQKGPDSLSQIVASGNTVKVLEKISTYSSERSEKHSNLIKTEINKKLLKTAEDLIWAKAYRPARETIKKLNKHDPSIKSKTLLLKSYIYPLLKL